MEREEERVKSQRKENWKEKGKGYGKEQWGMELGRQNEREKRREGKRGRGKEWTREREKGGGGVECLGCCYVPRKEESRRGQGYSCDLPSTLSRPARCPDTLQHTLIPYPAFHYMCIPLPSPSHYRSLPTIAM